MKQSLKLLIVSLFLCLPFIFARGQVVIEMEEDGGVYRIPCVVNGAKMKLVFDTGAATVCISESIAEYLLDNDYLSNNDIVGLGNSTVADGRIVNNLHIILRDIEIAGLHLSNVEAVVIEGQKAPLLFGQSAIQKLGRVSLDGNKLIIEAASNDIDESRIQALLDKGNTYYSQANYYAALEPLAEVHRIAGLNPAGIGMLATCYLSCDKEDNVISLFEEWESLYEDEVDWFNKDTMYGNAGLAYYFKGNYYKAISIEQKRIEVLKNSTREADVESLARGLALSYGVIGDCYSKLGNDSSAAENHQIAVNSYLTSLGMTVEDVASGKTSDSTLGLLFFQTASDYSAYSTEFEMYMCFACKCNYQPAISLLNDVGLYDEYMARFNRVHNNRTNNTTDTQKKRRIVWDLW